MRRKSRKTRNKKKHKGGTHKRPLGLRRVTLPVPNKTASGAFKTIWKVEGSNRVVINSTQEQTKDDKTPYRTQLKEFAFSRRLYKLFPQFFPEVSFFEGNEKELTVIDQLKNNNSDERLKYIWLKENCPPPSDEEIQTTYLKKAIQLLVDLMKQGLCYMDIKPMNVGKRGEDYVVIDTDPEDIYYVPQEYQQEYQKDYLKGEIIICGMCVYHYLKDKGLPIPYEDILSVFALVLNQSGFETNLDAYLQGKKIEIPEDIESFVRTTRTSIYKKYTDENTIDMFLTKIQDENKEKLTIPKRDKILLISARLKNYVSLKDIGQFFRDYKSTPLSPSSLDV